MRKLEKTIASECGRYKVEIERRSDGDFQATGYKYIEEWVPGYGKVSEFWGRVPQLTTLTDTLESAEQLARELLRCLG